MPFGESLKKKHTFLRFPKKYPYGLCVLGRRASNFTFRTRSESRGGKSPSYAMFLYGSFLHTKA